MYSPEGANPYIRNPIRVIVHIDHVLAGGIGPGQPRLAGQDHARNRMPHACMHHVGVVEAIPGAWNA